MEPVVTVLTGRRPDLLDQTLTALPYQPTVFVNGADQVSIEVALEHRTGMVVWDQWLTVGDATSRVAEWVRGRSEKYWLHCEDDWVCEGVPDLLPAMTLLDTGEIGQVRLRRKDDGAKPVHYLTGQKITWRGAVVLIGESHATFNPTLMLSEAAGLFPVNNEVDFMRRMMGRWPVNGQADPGWFTHIGGGRSLR